MDKLLRNKPDSSVKVKFVVLLEAVEKLGDDAGKHEYALEWSRGKDQTGKTKKKKAVDDAIAFNEKLEFDLRLYREKDVHSTLEAKHLSFSLKEKQEKGKKASNLGKAMINLTDFVYETGPVTKQISLKKEKGPFLKLVITPTITKIGRKKVVHQSTGEVTLEVDDSDISESEVLDPPSESDSGVESPKKVSSSSSKKQLKRTNTVSKEKDEKKDKDKDEKKDEKKDDKKDKKDKKKDEGDMVKSPSSSRLTVDGEKTERSTSSKHLTKVPSKRDLKADSERSDSEPQKSSDRSNEVDSLKRELETLNNAFKLAREKRTKLEAEKKEEIDALKVEHEKKMKERDDEVERLNNALKLARERKEKRANEGEASKAESEKALGDKDSEIQKLKADLASTSEALKNAQSEKDRLEKEKHELESERKKISKDKDKLDKEKDKAEKESERLEREKQSLEKEKASLQSLLSDKEAELSRLSSEHQATSDLVSRNKKDSELLVSQKEVELKEKERLFAEREKEKEKEFQTKALTIAQEFEKLKEVHQREMQQLQDKLTDAQSSSSSTKEELERLRDELVARDEELQELRNSLTNSDSASAAKLKSYETKVAELSVQFKQMFEEKTETLKNLESLTEEKAQLERDLKVSTQQAAELKASMEKSEAIHKREIEALQGNDKTAVLEKKDSEIERLKDEVESLQEKLLDSQEKVGSLKDQIKASAKKGDSSADLVKSLESKHAEKLAEYEQKLENTKSTIRNLTGEVKTLKSELNKRDAEAMLLEQEKNQIGEELIKTKDKLEEQTVRSNLLKTQKSLEPDQEATKLLEKTVYFMSSTSRTLNESEGSDDESQAQVRTADKRIIKLREALINQNRFTAQNGDFLRTIQIGYRKSFQRAGSSTGEVIYWLRQTAILHDEFLTYFGKGDPRMAVRTVERYGILVEVTPMSELSLAPLRYLNDLSILLLEMYQQLLNVVQTKVNKLLKAVVFMPLSTLTAPRAKGSADPSTSIKQITHVYDRFLEKLDRYGVPNSVVLQLFMQLFANVDRAVFNELISNAKDYCDAERGFHLKLVASQLDDWKLHSAWLKQKTSDTGHPLPTIGSVIHIEQVGNVLVLDKNLFTDRQVFKDYFSALTNAQIYHLLTHFKPSQLSPNPVSKSILAQIEKWGTSSNVKQLLIKDELLSYLPPNMATVASPTK